MTTRLPLGWLYDPFDMPSSNGKPSKADRIWRAHQRRLAAAREARVCGYCGRPLEADETDYCRLCNVDISLEER